MAGYFTSATAYAEISDNAALDFLPGDGWTMAFMLYPVSGDTQNAFGYIYSHEEPLNFQAAVNIIRLGTAGPDYNKIRIIIDWPGGNLFDSTSSISLNDDEWNHLVVTYDGTSFRVHLNGATETSTPPSLPDVQPASVARIGNATSSPIGTRWFPGRICHVAQWSRPFSNSDGEAWSGTFFSPEFAQNSLQWHVPMFTNQVHDDMGVIAVSAAGGMDWDRHAPVVYPFSQMQGRGAGAAPVNLNTFAYYRAS